MAIQWSYFFVYLFYFRVYFLRHFHLGTNERIFVDTCAQSTINACLPCGFSSRPKAPRKRDDTRKKNQNKSEHKDKNPTAARQKANNPGFSHHKLSSSDIDTYLPDARPSAGAISIDKRRQITCHYLHHQRRSENQCPKIQEAAGLFVCIRQTASTTENTLRWPKGRRGPFRCNMARPTSGNLKIFATRRSETGSGARSFQWRSRGRNLLPRRPTTTSSRTRTSPWSSMNANLAPIGTAPGPTSRSHRQKRSPCRKTAAC